MMPPSLASQGLAWRRFGQVHPRTQTPIAATAVVSIALATLAIAFPLGTLARITSFVALAIFCSINLALLRIKSQSGRAAFTVPTAVPFGALTLALGMLIYEGIRYL